MVLSLSQLANASPKILLTVFGIVTDYTHKGSYYNCKQFFHIYVSLLLIFRALLIEDIEA